MGNSDRTRGYSLKLKKKWEIYVSVANTFKYGNLKICSNSATSKRRKCDAFYCFLVHFNIQL